MNGVAIPAIEKATNRLIELWDHKAKLAQGKAFDMSEDVKGLSVDVILAYYFGEDISEYVTSVYELHVRHTLILRTES
jgi:hypothetical protein